MLDLRTPKGTLDYNPEQAKKLQEITEKIKKIYEAHAGVPIQTPIFELREILTNKYGDDAKLIYNLEDQGGDICSLRYDLTVPFSRFLCMNRIQKIRRYQIGSVFRRDNPSFKTGRLREFIQADFDICGSNLPMVNDSEVIKMIYDILGAFNIPYKFKIKINDKRILMSLLELCQVPAELQQTACSTIDKLGKLTMEELTREFELKGLSEFSIQQISNIIFNRKAGNKESIEFLKGLEHEELQKAVSEMEILLKYLDLYKVDCVEIDLSLARGLDYYTGIIIEALYEGTDVGSVAGGGRYDNLCSGLSNNSLKVPCVGFSIGVNRIFALSKVNPVAFDVFVGSGFGLNIEERMKILKEVWDLNLKGETFTGKRVNYKDQVEYAKKNGFRTCIFTGDNEIEKDICIILDLETQEKKEIERKKLREYLCDFFKIDYTL